MTLSLSNCYHALGRAIFVRKQTKHLEIRSRVGAEEPVSEMTGGRTQVMCLTVERIARTGWIGDDVCVRLRYPRMDIDGFVCDPL